MTGAAHDIAGAALPVAVGLLVLALAARAALWAPADSPRLRALARTYLAPLSTWCLIAAGAYTMALAAAGDAAALAFAVPVLIAVAAVAARTQPELRDAHPGAEPAAAPPPGDERPATPAATAPAGARSLWAEPEGDARTGLWSR